MRNEAMRNGMACLWVVSALALVWPVAAGADELGDLRQALQEQKMRSAELENRINQLEARQERPEGSVPEAIEPEATTDTDQASGGGLPKSLEWLEKIKLTGDFRYRYEYIDEETKAERHRNRIRARLMISAVLNDEWDVAFRLGSGQADFADGELYGDPISGNQTLGQGFSHKPFWLDQAYFDYHPLAIEGLNVLGGKIANPFYRSEKHQLMWDSDLNPEGIGFQLARAISGSDTLHINGGGFWVAERSSDADTSLWGIQGYIKHAMGQSAHVLAGAGFYDYGNIQGQEFPWSNLFGNTSSDPNASVWANDYDILEVFAEYGTQVRGLPVVVYGSWLQNTAASNDNTGWIAGTRIGKAKEPGSWQFVYDYRDLEKDAVVAIFTDSDFIGGGSGGRGHRFGFGYQLARHVQAALTYFDNTITRTTPERDYKRVQGDIVLKF